ncbi:hypothetical protein NDU88_000063 [Pleurodeles waltl]|uniref:Uncharacterized protein n=1 Tax=Pleurodeles waltl TaxID=8319 RepID=A0AAV7V430_PLEWA|nr:hypothetical protein NDU88_000063 [Pleurodeles waltl]
MWVLQVRSRAHSISHLDGAATQHHEPAWIDSSPPVPPPAATPPSNRYCRSPDKCLSKLMKGRAHLFALPERPSAAAQAAQPVIYLQPTSIHLSQNVQPSALGPRHASHTSPSGSDNSSLATWLGGPALPSGVLTLCLGGRSSPPHSSQLLSGFGGALAPQVLPFSGPQQPGPSALRSCATARLRPLLIGPPLAQLVTTPRRLQERVPRIAKTQGAATARHPHRLVAARP